MRLKTGIFGFLVVLSLNLCPLSSAFASPEPVEDDGAIEYINELSSASSIPAGDLVAVIAGANSIYTGVNWVNPDGSIALKNQLSPNLVSYKKNVLFGSSWEELDSTTQTQWGSQDNYNAANFNSSLDAYGLGDARDRFYASGGSNFSWTSEEQSILDKIKGVYDDWNSGKDALIGNVLDLFQPDAEEDFKEYLGVTNTATLDMSDVSGWPSSLPTTFHIAKSDFGFFSSGYSYSTSPSVYMALCAASSLPIPGTSKPQIICFSESPFLFNLSSGSQYQEPTNSANSAVYDDKTYYYSVSNYPSSYMNVTTFNLPVNYSTGGNMSSSLITAARIILFGTEDIPAIGVISPDISDYPEDISAHATVGSYFPSDGIEQDTSWTSYLEKIEEDTDDMVELLKRILTQVKLLDTTSEDLTDLEGYANTLVSAVNNFSFYSNGILKVHDEGIFDSITDIGTDISEIVSILRNWHTEDNASQIIGDFDFPEYQTKAETLEETLEDIMPFGAIFLVSGLVGSIADINVVSEPKITIPWNFFPDHKEEIVIDVSWIEDGKNMIHAFMIFTLLLSLTMLTIGFVKSEV